MSNTPTNQPDDELRRHNAYDSLLTKVLMEQHHHDWDMETIREAALICSNTMIPEITAAQNTILDAAIAALPRYPSDAEFRENVQYSFGQSDILSQVGKALLSQKQAINQPEAAEGSK